MTHINTQLYEHLGKGHDRCRYRWVDIMMNLRWFDFERDFPDLPDKVSLQLLIDTCFKEVKV